MPISVAKIASNTASLALQIEGDTLNVVYFPGRVTEKVFATLQSFSTASQTSEELLADFQQFNETLAGLIQSWDVFEDEAQTIPFPVDPARFPELPFAFRMDVVNAIMGDIRPEVQAQPTQS